jgi:hypothetical protein
MYARDALDRLVAAITESPRITHCADSECERCRDAVLGGPLV